MGKHMHDCVTSARLGRQLIPVPPHSVASSICCQLISLRSEAGLLFRAGHAAEAKAPPPLTARQAAAAAAAQQQQKEKLRERESQPLEPLGKRKANPTAKAKVPPPPPLPPPPNR